jgi:hypothetical protein
LLLGLSFAIPGIDRRVGRHGRKRHPINLDRLLKNPWRKCELEKKGGKRREKRDFSGGKPVVRASASVMIDAQAAAGRDGDGHA